MNLYLVRHAEASASMLDPTYPITPNGIQQAKILGQKLLTGNYPIARIFHSGLLRAQQTASLLAEALNLQEIAQLNHLLPNDSIDPICVEVETWTENTLVVSHLPFLGYLLESLTGAATGVTFQNTTCVILACDEDKWWVEAILEPNQTT